MSLNSTPSGERVQIGFFGRRNAGKSSLFNSFAGFDMSIVSSQKGTTTDPVSKAMELLPLGPVVLIDTPGLDDEGELGFLRIQKSYEAMRKIHIAILVIGLDNGLADEDIRIYNALKEREIPTIVALNKCDLLSSELLENNRCQIIASLKVSSENVILTSVVNSKNIKVLKEKVAELGSSVKNVRSLLPNSIKPKDIVILVTPIDSSAPKGRIILPQQQVLRALLDIHATSIVCQVDELKETINNLEGKISYVITDSQAFKRVNEIVADRIPLTSFSILMAKYKGDFEWQLKGSSALDEIGDGDKVLIAEGCVHHRQCEDIGTVKLPNWIRKKCGEGVVFDFLSGTEFKSEDELKAYKLVVQCGGCMLNEKEIKYRVECCKKADVPITNYGMAIAKLNGILDVVMKY